MPRTFLAADLDASFLDAMAALGERLRGLSSSMGDRAPRASWVAQEGMHVTLKFFGDVDDALVPRLAELTRAVGGGRRAPEVRAEAVDAFPTPRRARVLVVALGGDDGALGAMADVAERGAVELGLPPEGRRFRPHLTLARLKSPGDVRALAMPLDGTRGTVESVTLYASELGRGPGGRPRYTPLERVTLAR